MKGDWFILLPDGKREGPYEERGNRPVFLPALAGPSFCRPVFLPAL
jgi:hypothetical protein